MVFNYKRKAKSNSYKCVDGQPCRRMYNSVTGIAIHYTGGSKDTAKNECDYFATGNDRYAGAHAFADYDGKTGMSIPASYIAWSVGDSSNGHGTLYNKYNNSNTISIELCGIAGRDISDKQLKALKKLIRYYKHKCPNITNIIRHYDVTTKACPARYCGTITNNNKWQTLKSELMFELKKTL